VVVGTTIAIYTNWLRGTSYLAWSVMLGGALRSCGQAANWAVLSVVGPYRPPSTFLTGRRGFGSLHPWPSALGQCTPSSCTVPSAGDSSGRPGPSDSLQGRHIDALQSPKLTHCMQSPLPKCSQVITSRSRCLYQHNPSICRVLRETRIAPMPRHWRRRGSTRPL